MKRNRFSLSNDRRWDDLYREITQPVCHMCHSETIITEFEEWYEGVKIRTGYQIKCSRASCGKIMEQSYDDSYEALDDSEKNMLF